LGSKAKVTNLTNGNSVEVKINDRGPFTEGRIIDLSRAAARALGILESGIALVRVELIAAASAQ
jgi:rare lipoprotein A